MAITKSAKSVTEYIFKAYGSHTGYLFGIPPHLRGAVEAVVQCALDMQEEYLMLLKEEECVAK